jgi:hypothetical protein
MPTVGKLQGDVARDTCGPDQLHSLRLFCEW